MERNTLILYRNTALDVELGNFITFMEEHKKTIMPNTEMWTQRESMSVSAINDFFDFAYQYGLSGNVWHGFLTMFLLSSENPFSYTWELNKEDEESSWDIVALKDFETIWNWKNYNFLQMKLNLPTGALEFLCNYPKKEARVTKFSSMITEALEEFSVHLGKAKDAKEILSLTKAFYKKYGIGVMGLNPAFSLEIKEDFCVDLDPIAHIHRENLEDIIGYEEEKASLLTNTEAFLQGEPSHHLLLFGGSGTGKSSCIKSLLRLYYEQGLRMIEVSQEQLVVLPKLLKKIKDRSYKFIIYIDNLATSRLQSEFKYLKDAIEGGLEKKVDQVLIYATSTEQHGVFEKSIYFANPTQEEFESIVLKLTKNKNIDLTEEEILAFAREWEVEQSGLSGRAARQCVGHLLQKSDNI